MRLFRRPGAGQCREETLAKLDIAPGAAYWIDMESGVRTQGRFDLAKCEAVCRAVYGQAGGPLRVLLV